MLTKHALHPCPTNWPCLHMCCKQVGKLAPWLCQAAVLAALLTSGSTKRRFDVVQTAAEVNCVQTRPSYSVCKSIYSS